MGLPRQQWDVFCRVIDNFGDIGVAWRLARNLASRGLRVRLWTDDASALRWMADAGIPEGITVLPWDDSTQTQTVGDVVIETFGCDLPEAFIEHMARRQPAPIWINLEYLSAESYVERSHGLSSPQLSGPGRGLNKRFFYPGFTPRTGGLLREPDLQRAQAQFDAAAWLRSIQAAPRPEERIVSLFDYDNARWPELLHALSPQPTLLLVCPGPAQQWLSEATLPPAVRWQALPYFSQQDFDHLLWSSDLNFVRGEDSFVRAQWAGRPFVWRIYPQDDGAHAPKLEAFMQPWLASLDTEQAQAWRGFWRRWNGLEAQALGSLPDLAPARQHASQWSAQLAQQADLLSQLQRFVSESG